uniref:Uncharacterized protein n=1 Tax=Caenorhabditis japonica TaxID=281687 RepID=A0A8R1ENT5_CAEJA
MPVQLRAAFSAIPAFSDIGETQSLNRGYDQEESETRAYYDIDERFVQLGKAIETFATARTIVIDNY